MLGDGAASNHSQTRWKNETAFRPLRAILYVLFTTGLGPMWSRSTV